MRAYITFAGGEIDGKKLKPKAAASFIQDPANFVSNALLGGKAYNLVGMCAKGLPVPPGFAITTAICLGYQKNPKEIMQAISDDLDDYLGWLETTTGYMPLVSVRSGAPVSMPGMMDTVLNVGLTPANMAQWSKRLGLRGAWDCRRRLLEMYASVVLDIDHTALDILKDRALQASKVTTIGAMTANQLYGYCTRIEHMLLKLNMGIPDDPKEQILAAIAAVFRSWNNPRAIEYRKLYNIADDMGTAVTVQTMVFGNMNANSGTGVLFTRNPSTGEPGVTGEFLVNAQGEDVVAGTATPRSFSGGKGWFQTAESESLPPLSEPLLKAFDQLVNISLQLDDEFADMQDIEFTIQDGKLFILQTRSGKRSATAAFRIAHDQLKAGAWKPEDLAGRLTLKQFFDARRPGLDVKKTEAICGAPVLAGVIGSTGVAVGRAVFTISDFETVLADGEAAILVAKETNPDDIALMAKVAGILTATGGATSHAAVVARGMDKVCITGCTDMNIIPGKATLPTGQTITAGTWLTLDGDKGLAYLGKGVTGEAGGAIADEIIRKLARDRGLALKTFHPAPDSWLDARPWLLSGQTEDLIVTLSQSWPEGMVLTCSDLSNAEVDGQFLGLLTGEAAPTDALLPDLAHRLSDVVAEGRHVALPGADKGVLTLLRAAGYGVITEVETLTQALNHQGPLILGEQLIKAAGPSRAAQEIVIDALKTAGCTVIRPAAGLAETAALIFPPA